MALGFGFGFGLQRGVASLIALAPAASVLTWDGNSADTTPDFDVDLPSGNGAPKDAAVNDVLRIQVSATGAGVWTTYLTHTLDAGDIAGTPITVSGVTPLTNATYDFRVRLERGAHISAWSAIEQATVNAASDRMMWGSDRMTWGSDAMTWV